jgi:GDP-4-dehydro-6-deoxy-D-mannose reductase
MTRALVTGASGFAGPYLIEHLLSQGYEVVAGVHGPEASPPQGCRQVLLDVTDRERVRRTVGEAEPEEIYHLAGLTRPASDDVEAFYGVNFGGALNLLEAASEHAPGARVLLVGSAYVYGSVKHPIAETEPLNPVNHYGVSKAAADLLGRSYALQGLRVVCARPFNHSGPRQSPDFVLPTLVRQFAEILAGEREPVVHFGNLDSVRDLSDVRDVVRGYRLALKEDTPGEVYNFGSGRGTSVRELIELVSREAGVEVELRVEPSRVRATDIPYLVADASKARSRLGWKAEIPLEKTVQDMLSTDLEQLKPGWSPERF